MKPLYTQKEFDTAKSINKLPLECKNCHNPFLISKNQIKMILKKHKSTSGHTGDFCSVKCKSSFQYPPNIIICEQCNKSFHKISSEVKRTKHNFCCKSCACKYHQSHKTKGTRISKLEKWLSFQLPILFPNLEFHFNQTDAINGELDIFIPSLKLAFELNGIFHYEPIYGINKFDAIQNNDHRKMLACAEQSIELCVIDVSHETYFKPTKAQKFLNIISNIIKTRLSGDLPSVS